MSSPEIILLDGKHRRFRVSVLKAHGYEVFATQHVIEVCLRWAPGECAALVIGPEFPWQSVNTLCDWIKINSPEKPIILLSDRQGARCPSQIDAVVPAQPVTALVDRLRVLLPILERDSQIRAAAVRAGRPIVEFSRSRNGLNSPR